MSQSKAEGCREKLCGMKYMHKARRDQQADKLTTPELWHRCHLDTYPSVPLPSRVAERTTQEAEAEGVFYAGELWAVEFNLGFTSDIVPPWLSSYWGQVYGVRQWGLSLWLAGLRPSHAQSIIAPSIMYQSLQTLTPAPQPSLHLCRPLHQPTINPPPPPSLTPSEGQAWWRRAMSLLDAGKLKKKKWEGGGRN